MLECESTEFRGIRLEVSVLIGSDCADYSILNLSLLCIGREDL